MSKKIIRFSYQQNRDFRMTGAGQIIHLCITVKGPSGCALCITVVPLLILQQIKQNSN